MHTWTKIHRMQAGSRPLTERSYRFPALADSIRHSDRTGPGATSSSSLPRDLTFLDPTLLLT